MRVAIAFKALIKLLVMLEFSKKGANTSGGASLYQYMIGFHILPELLVRALQDLRLIFPSCWLLPHTPQSALNASV